MHLTHPTCAINQAIKTSPVIQEVVDVQLREAAWASMARLRQLATPTSTLTALRRWELFLCSNMSGLACVFGARLAVRLTHLLHAPEDLTSESFVAGMLLLRCDRARYETQVVAAWQKAPCAEIQKQLSLALMHGGVAQARNQDMLRDLLLSDDVALRRSAASVVSALRLNLGRHAELLRARAQHDADTALIVLEMSAEDLLPIDADAIVAALGSGDSDLHHGAERVLFAHAPLYLAQRARAQLDRGDSPSLLGLEAMAVGLLAPDTDATQDLIRLKETSLKGRLAPLAMHALGLSGLPSAALMLLQLLAHSTAAQMPEANLEAFGAITGIEARASEHASWHQAQGSLGVAQALQRAWGQKHPTTSVCVPTLFGRSPSATHLIAAIESMQVGRWQSIVRLLHARSQRRVKIDAWALLQQQISQVMTQQQEVDAAFGSAAKGLRHSRLSLALGRLQPARPAPSYGAWA